MKGFSRGSGDPARCFFLLFFCCSFSSAVLLGRQVKVFARLFLLTEVVGEDASDSVLARVEVSVPLEEEDVEVMDLRGLTARRNLSRMAISASFWFALVIEVSCICVVLKCGGNWDCCSTSTRGGADSILVVVRLLA